MLQDIKDTYDSTWEYQEAYTAYKEAQALTIKPSRQGIKTTNQIHYAKKKQESNQEIINKLSKLLNDINNITKEILIARLDVSDRVAQSMMLVIKAIKQRTNNEQQ